MNPEFLNRGLSLYTAGRIPEALWQFFEALDAEPRDPLGRYLCGLAFEALGLEQEARAEWRWVMDLTHFATEPNAISDADTQWVHDKAAHLLQYIPPKPGSVQ